MDDYTHYQYQQYSYQQPQLQPQPQQDPSSQVQTYTHDHHQSTPQAYHDYGHDPNNNNNNNQQYQYQYYPPPDYSSHSYYPPPDPAHTQINTYYSVQNPAPANSQLTQFAGSTDSSQRSMQPQNGQAARGGGGRRGGRNFRGRGHHAPSFRGRGRGRGGGRYFPLHGVASTSNSAIPPADVATSAIPPSVSVPGHVPIQPPPKMAWCELCRVDCNTPEILEQHKNGKRHKKNLQKYEELQNLNKLLTGQQNVTMTNSEVQAEVPQSENVIGSKEEATQEPTLVNTVGFDDRNETEQQKDVVEKSKRLMAEPAAGPERKSSDHFEAKGHGFKRKRNGGRGGKYVRINDGPKRPAEPPKPNQVIPFICELCNVRCESQVVFDSHLAGKKHLSKLKRFHGHQALFGEAGLQALYPPNINATSSSIVPQTQQGLTDPQVVLAQLLTYVLTQAHTPGLVGTQVPGLAYTPTAAITPAAPMPALAHGSSLQTQYHQYPIQGSEAGIGKHVTVEAESGQHSIAAEFEAPPLGSLDTKKENGALASEVKNVSLPQDNSNSLALPKDDMKDSFSQNSSVMASSKNPDKEADQVSSAEKAALKPKSNPLG